VQTEGGTGSHGRESQTTPVNCCSLALSPGDPVPPSSFAHLFRLLQQTMGKGGSSNCSLRVDNLAGAALASSMHIKQTGHIRKLTERTMGL
jgi:hypothetical protein